MTNNERVFRNIKLKKINVDGYKNLVNCETEFHDFNILVGPNNSGKSNFLEIFSLLVGLSCGSEEFRKRIFESAIAPHGSIATCNITGHKSKPISVSLLLENHDAPKGVLEIEYMVEIQCKAASSNEETSNIQLGFVSEKLSAKYKSKTGRANIIVKRERNVLKVRKKSGNFSQSRINEYTSFLMFIPAVYDDTYKTLDSNSILALLSVMELIGIDLLFASADNLRNSIGSEKKETFNKLRTTSFDLTSAISEIHKNKLLYKEFESVLCQILDLEDIRFNSIPVPDKLRKDSEDMPKVINFFQLKLHGQPFTDIRNYSDGTLVVTAILVMLLSPDKQKPLLCIEEPENCLHPKALKTLMSYLIQKSIDRQILITTHSPYILNHVSPEDVIVAKQHRDGGTRFERITNIKELHKRLEKGYVSFGELLETEFENDKALV